MHVDFVDSEVERCHMTDIPRARVPPYDYNPRLVRHVHHVALEGSYHGTIYEHRPLARIIRGEQKRFLTKLDEAAG